MEIAAQTLEMPPRPAAPRPLRRWTLEEFLRREEQAKERHEYYDGIIKTLPMARSPHNEITANTIFALKMAIRIAQKKLRVMSSQQLVYLPKLNFGLYPDALVISEKLVHWDTNQVLLINPILIVEVLSKSTRNYDRRDKFNEYKTLDSFREYVLIDQDECRIETRFREEPNLWRETVEIEMSGSIFFKSIGCAISLADVYENIEFPPPSGRAFKKR